MTHALTFTYSWLTVVTWPCLLGSQRGWACTPPYRLVCAVPAIHTSYRIVTIELHILHANHKLSVSLLHTYYLCSRTLVNRASSVWSIADFHGRGARPWLLGLLLKAIRKAEPDVSGDRQQVFANSNACYHTLHSTFSPFLRVSATSNIFHSLYFYPKSKCHLVNSYSPFKTQLL